MKISVFSYSEYSRKHTIKYIEELIGRLNFEYRIRLPVEAIDGYIAHELFSQFMIEFICTGRVSQ